MAVDIGPRIGIDGEAEYRRTLQNIIQQQKTLKSEMQATTAAFDKNTSAQEKTRKTAEVLNKQIEVQKQRVAELEKGLAAASDKYGEADSRTQKWQQAVNNANADLSRMEQQLAALPSRTQLVGEAFQNVGGKIEAVGQKISAVGSSLTRTFTVPILGAGTLAVKKFADVDKTMTLVNKTMGNTEVEAKKIEQAMASAAANSIFGMDDAATASLNFARAGLSAEEAAAALAPAMNLAAGEGGDLDTVSGGLVATINGFHGSFEDAAKYADVFASACNNSALDVNSLSDAMSVAAPIFSAAGYSLEDAALYMGVMANNGIEADKAANSLKTGLARLVSPAKEGAEMMEEFGISATNMDGSLKDTITLQRELNEVFSKFNEEGKIRAASAIFGKNQMAPWLALIETAPDDVEALNTALRNCTGTTNEMAAAMMGGFGGSIEKLKSSIDVLMTTSGGLIANVVQPMIDKIQFLVDKYNALDDASKERIMRVAGIVAAVGPLLLVVGKLTSGVGSLITTIGSAIILGPVIIGAIAPVLPLVLGIGVGIGALVAAGVALYKNWDTIKAKATEFKDGLAADWASMKTNFAKNWDAMTEKVSAAWNSIVDKVRSGVDKIKNLFSFNWELPKLKLPHFSWSWNDLGVIRIPNISVDWYRKAYSNPVMFNSPTVLQTPGGLKGFGDGNGGEVVIGRNMMYAMIRDAVQSGGAANTFNGDINVTVYGAEGQSNESLADMVAQRIYTEITQRRAAFG